MAKVDICVARGRKTYDKREALKNKDAKRDMDRVASGARLSGSLRVICCGPA